MNSQTVYIVAQESMVPFFANFFNDGQEIAILLAFCYAVWAVFERTFNTLPSKTRYDRLIVRSLWVLISLVILFSGSLITNSTIVWIAVAAMSYRLYNSPLLGVNPLVEKPEFTPLQSPWIGPKFNEPFYCQPPYICRSGSYNCPECPKNLPLNNYVRCPSSPAVVSPKTYTMPETEPQPSRLRSMVTTMICSLATYLFGVLLAKMVYQPNNPITASASTDESLDSFDDSSSEEDDIYVPVKKQVQQPITFGGARCPPPPTRNNVRFESFNTVPDCDDNVYSFVECPNMPKPSAPMTRSGIVCPSTPSPNAPSSTYKSTPNTWDMVMQVAPNLVEPVMSKFGASPQHIDIAKAILKRYGAGPSSLPDTPPEERIRPRVSPPTIDSVNRLFSQYISPVGATGPTTAEEAASIRRANELKDNISDLAMLIQAKDALAKAFGLDQNQTQVSNAATTMCSTTPCNPVPPTEECPTVHISDSEAESSSEDFSDLPPLESMLAQVTEQDRISSPTPQ